MTIHNRIPEIILLFSVVLALGCWDDSGIEKEVDPITPNNENCGDLTAMAKRSVTLSDSEKKAWHKSNLYDSTSDSYYLPPELFYASTWNGEKGVSEPEVDYFTGYTFCHQVVGPKQWTHPETGETFPVYHSSWSSSTEYLRATDQGIELVHRTSDKTYYEGAIKYPSGPGWQIHQPETTDFRKWKNGTQSEHTQTIEIDEILFDNEGVLAWVLYRMRIDGELKGEYMLEPKRGITHTYFFGDDAYDGVAHGHDCADKPKMASMDYVLSEQEMDAWSKENLYDSSTDSYYIPAELWTGAVWDGNKSLTLHDADLYFGSAFCKRITGPTTWTHPFNDEVYQIYTRTNKGKISYFVITPKGVGRVYENRSEGMYWENEVKFPAGDGWRMGERVSLAYRRWYKGEVKDRIRKIEITQIVFDENDVLAAIRYRYYAGDEGHILDHEYLFMPKRGMVHTQKFSD